jgi:hypothetical protein
MCISVARGALQEQRQDVGAARQAAEEEGRVQACWVYGSVCCALGEGLRTESRFNLKPKHDKKKRADDHGHNMSSRACLCTRVKLKTVNFSANIRTAPRG